MFRDGSKSGEKAGVGRVEVIVEGWTWWFGGGRENEFWVLACRVGKDARRFYSARLQNRRKEADPCPTMTNTIGPSMTNTPQDPLASFISVVGSC